MNDQLQIHDILKQYWGYDAFRPLQEDIITSTLSGKDALALLPTGGGKSLCYQVPAMAKEGIAIVISPLIALMKDQVENLKKRGILAAAIYSGMSRRQVIQTLKNVAHGPYKFLYVSPERLETRLFKEYLPAFDVNLLAVDEAHCISQWGYDFRPSYLKIAELRKELNNVPVLALTASATKEVQDDICEKLQLQQPAIFRQPFARPNLSYSVLTVESKLAKVVDIIKKVPGTSIVYCKSRRRTVEIASLLNMHGLSAAYYHAGLSGDERSDRQQQWIDNKITTMVCTNAFGMGIDKPDVRLVVHVDCPDCLENYYQEAGRAGRDGKKSFTVLLFNEHDRSELLKVEKKRYPSFGEIKKVYSALVNYLQLPANSGDENSYTFQFETFAKNFQLDAYTGMYALKAIEQDGWMEMSEQSFRPSTIMFSCNKQNLQQFEETYPEYEPLLTTLLRTYPGIFDMPVFITEQNIAKLLAADVQHVIRQLNTIRSHGIIQYEPRDEAPKISFKKNRVAVEDFTINLHLYEKRRRAFVQRVENMLAYVSASTCRSIYIGNYFGDADHQPCGICDNCIRKKNKDLSPEEFNIIHERIKTMLTNKAITANELLDALKEFRKEKTWQVIEFLQSENKLAADANGILHIK